jgi:hypothetical protein
MNCKVRCADCGFLAAIVRTPAPEPVDQAVRRNGGSPIHSPVPWCFVNAFDLQKEVAQRPDPTAIKANVLTVIVSERECDRFCEWKAGLSLEEHQKMQIEERKVSDQRAYEKALKRGERIDKYLLAIGAVACTAIGGILVALFGPKQQQPPAPTQQPQVHITNVIPSGLPVEPPKDQAGKADRKAP